MGSYIIRIYKRIKRELTRLFYKLILGKLGQKSYIISPLHIECPENIFIGDDVVIREQTWLASVPLTGTHTSRLEIGNGTVIGHFNHIYATHSIIIEDNVLTADKVYISDNFHEYRDVELPIIKQPIIQKGNVVVGSGTWLGENVCVLGTCIGKHCVIGANSVVTCDIPDYSVAAGIPARVIKRYDFERKEWVKVY